MTNPFKNFTLQKTLKQLSTDGIFELCDHLDSGFASTHAELREDGKREPLLEKAKECLTQNLEIEQRAHSLTRIGHFFGQNKPATAHLVKYVQSKGITPDQEMLGKCATGTEQAVRLCLRHETQVREYFIISLHTRQSKRYWQCRHDYCGDNFPQDAATIKKLQDEIRAIYAAEGRGDHCALQQFEYDGKRYLFMELQDTPAELREWSEGKVTERFTVPVSEVVIILNENAKTVEVMAEDSSKRSEVHVACAQVLFETKAEAKPRDNEIYDLNALMELIANNQPIAVAKPEDYKVERIFPQLIRVAMTTHPYWEVTLNLKIAKKKLVEDVHNDGMHKALKSIVRLEGEEKGYWRRSAIKITHAELAAVYWDGDQERVSKVFTINNKGGSNLAYEDEDKEINRFLRGANILISKEDLSEPETPPAEQIAYAS